MYLVVATSGRAIAQALSSSGNAVAVIDGFADMDTCHAAKICKKVTRTNSSLDANEVVKITRSLKDQFTFDGLLYDAALETNPDLLDAVCVDNVIGNSSKTLRQCNDISLFFSTMEKFDIPFPEVCDQPQPQVPNSWLKKRKLTTGGFGVSFFEQGDESNENLYFQRKLDGLNFSLTFFANGNDIKVVGFNTLWSKSLTDKVPYAYAGAINNVGIAESLKTTAIHYAKSLIKEFKLVGLNSIDYILSDNSVYVIEINPRIPASYELYETKYGDLINEHISVSKTKSFCSRQWSKLLRAHAIVYAPETIKVPNDISWPLWAADRPHAGEIINQYQPVCSIFAGGKNEAQVKNMLRMRESTIIKNLIQIN